MGCTMQRGVGESSGTHLRPQKEKNRLTFFFYFGKGRDVWLTWKFEPGDFCVRVSVVGWGVLCVCFFLYLKLDERFVRAHGKWV
ncbi:hypothetical protein CEXT_780091 [Caerostris extrusa]|uniref:Uncharacterized protein n=1 Tax=Caerostris extrusa TaxID=172846 RepID=A0AAV4X542_CAEEX|nr:hypothetical protein CEXT_780091 [Caerostris extrusa]